VAPIRINSHVKSFLKSSLIYVETEMEECSFLSMEGEQESSSLFLCAFSPHISLSLSIVLQSGVQQAFCISFCPYFCG
jgi:hypothetical protein